MAADLHVDDLKEDLEKFIPESALARGIRRADPVEGMRQQLLGVVHSLDERLIQ